MELYILEMMVFIIISIILGIIIKFKKIKNGKKFFLILVALFLVTLTITFVVEKPKVNLISKNIELEVCENGKISKPKTIYHFKDITNDVKIIGDIDYNKIGDYEVEYVIPTILGQYKVKQKVTILDTKAPEIILNGEKEINQSYKTEYEEQGYEVKDNYDTDLNEKVQIEKQEISENEYNIVYTVEDSSGNKATETRKINIIDDIPPQIILNGNSYTGVLLGEKYEEKGAKAEDEKDGDLTDKIEISGTVDTSKEGTYTITYKVIDTKGNEASAVRKVTVSKKNTTPARDGTDGAKGVIYLTFDDGPSESITPKILDILKQKNVKATFFIINYTSTTLENLVKRAYNEGHTIAIHGYSHDYKTIYKSVDAYMNNITKLQEKISKTTGGYNATITRFPGGSSNTVSRYNPGIMSKLTKEVVARGYKYFDWNVSSGDAGDVKTSQAVYNNVTNSLKKDRANVVLMHDFSGNTKTLNALADIIDYGINNGYTFSAITESTPMVTHSVNN